MVGTEVTDRRLIVGERHLRQVLAVYADHYNRRRPHRALRLRAPRPTSLAAEPVHGRIRRRPIRAHKRVRDGGLKMLVRNHGHVLKPDSRGDDLPDGGGPDLVAESGELAVRANDQAVIVVS